MPDHREPSDPYDVFERQAGDERRARLAEAEARNRRERDAEVTAGALRKIDSDAFTRETNERLRIAEYRFHGVEPPVIDGVPTRSSFHLLRSLGWTVEDMLGQKMMVAPPARTEDPLSRRREDYDQNT